HLVLERRRQDDRLLAVLEIAQATLEGRGEEELLRLIAQRARALAESSLAMVVLLDPDRETATVAAADGQRADAVTGRRVLLAGSAPGQASVPAATESSPTLTLRLASGER